MYIILIHIHVDGAASGNPGRGGIGIVIKADNIISEYSLSLGDVSNHEAEFLAVLHALRICAKHFPQRILAFQSDSQLVVQAIEKGYVKNASFKEILDEILKVSINFPHFFIKWVPNEQNKHADRLAKEAIRKQK